MLVVVRYLLLVIGHWSLVIGRGAAIALCCGLFYLLSGCFSHSEDPNLLNSTPTDGLIQIRYLNLSDGTYSRALRLVAEGTSATTSRVTQTEISPNITISRDSAMAIITDDIDTLKNYKNTSRIKFQRRSYHTIISLPQPKNSQKQPAATDTVITLTMSQTVDPFRNPSQAGLRIVNCYPASSVSFSIILGCPSGTPIAQNLAFRNISSPTPVQADTVAVSIQQKDSTTGIITPAHSYQFLARGGQDYTIVIYEVKTAGKKGKSIPAFKILDERDSSANAFQELKVVGERTAEVRVMNFSATDEIAVKRGSDTVSAKVNKSAISVFVPLSTCINSTADVIGIFKNIATNAAITTATATFDVGKKYSVVVADYGTGSANTAIVVPSPVATSLPTDKTRLRFLNLDKNGTPISILRGSRQTQSGIYEAGAVLQSSLPFGAVSAAVEVSVGDLPLAIFSATQPQRFLQSGVQPIIGGNQYLVVFAKNPKDANSQAIFLVPEDSQPAQTTIQPMDAGGFVQFINAVPSDGVGLGVAGLEKATLRYGEIIATVLPVNTKLGNGTVTNGGRATVVLAGKDATQPESFVFPAFPPDANSIKRRVVHAVKALDMQPIRVAFNPPDSTYIDSIYISKTEPVVYGKSSESNNVQQQQQRSELYFWKSGDSKVIYLRISDVLLTTGKAYTLIFAPGSVAGTYAMLVVQEY